MYRLTLDPVFQSYLLAAMVALLSAGLLWWGPRRQKTSSAGRMALGLIRLAIITLLALAMLRPTLVYTETKKQAAALVVLADRSRSMTVPDALGNQTRWEALRRALGGAAGPLKRLQRDFEVKAYTFDAELHEAAANNGAIELPERPDGEQTAIGAALDDVLRRTAGKRLLGVVLLSDGAQRALAPRDLPPQSAAARLKHRGDPLFTFTLGQSRGLGEAKDVALRDLSVSPSVFVKNELSVGGLLRVDGYVNVDIPVRVLLENSQGKMETVAQQTVRAANDGQSIPIEMRFTPNEPGEYRLALEVDAQAGELVSTNNRLDTFVQVLDGGLNVLYVEGALRVESKFIRRALDASPDVKVDFVRLDARDPASVRAADLSARLKPGRYEVYILGDVDASAFDEKQLAELAECVRRGAGLVMLGGRQSFGAGGWGQTPLGRALPVGMDPLERQRPDEPVRADLHWPGPLVMRPTMLGLGHFVMELAGSRGESAAVWSKLPPLEGANRLHDPAPGAVVLAEAGPDRPLLVAQNYGEGRVLAFAADSTWRWWMRGHEPAFKRFWRQVVLWLARKDQRREGGVWIQLARRRFAPTERIEFAAGAGAPSGEPIKDAVLTAEVVLPDGTRRPIALARQDDQATGTLRDLQTAGDYAIVVSAARNGQPLGNARARFHVFHQDLELDNAAADSSTMESLAAISDGQSLPPEQLPELIERLARETQHLEIRQETKKTFWDTWPFFLALVGLLTAEWYLRKRWGLV